MERYYVEKSPGSQLDYTISFDTWLQDVETIATHTWTVPAGLTKYDQTDADRTSTVWLSGGTVDTIYTVSLHIVTSLNREEDRELIVFISPAIRDGMIPLVLDLRSLTSTAMGDTTINDVVYWSDYQLQVILDKYATRHIDVELIPIPQIESSSTAYYTYSIPSDVSKYIDESTVQIVDQYGVVASPSETNILQGYVVFAADTSGDPYYIRCTSYNMRMAAARVWLDKASHRSELIDWKAGGQTLSEDQAYQHCMERAAYFAGSAGIAGVMSGNKASAVIRLKKVGYGQPNRRVTDDYSFATDSDKSPYA